MILLLAFLPIAPPAVQTVERIEHNRVYSSDGRHCLDQWIFYDDGQIQAWRLKGHSEIERDYQRGGWLLRWHDGDTFREVRAAAFSRSVTQYDVEVFERDIFPKEQRRGLGIIHQHQGR